MGVLRAPVPVPEMNLKKLAKDLPGEELLVSISVGALAAVVLRAWRWLKKR